MATYARMVTSAQIIKTALDMVEQEDFEKIPLEQLKLKLASLAANWKMYQRSHGAYMARLTSDEEVNEQMEIYQSMDQQYWKARIALVERIRELKNQKEQVEYEEQEHQTNEYENFENGLRAPEVSSMRQSFLQNQAMWKNPSFRAIENTWGEFDGTLTQWQGFHDRFSATIHQNEQLSGAYKFMYLKNSLKGKALQALGE